MIVGNKPTFICHHVPPHKKENITHCMQRYVEKHDWPPDDATRATKTRVTPTCWGVNNTHQLFFFSKKMVSQLKNTIIPLVNLGITK